jgi:holo-[acyl-carrier protein] synthase
MIAGIGCDLVNHKVTKELKWKSNEKMLPRILSNKEMELHKKNNSIRFLAGRFAAKEAVLKCLGTGMEDGIALSDIQLLQIQNGKPIIELKGKVKSISDKKGICGWHISISHANGYTIALAIAEKY